MYLGGGERDVPTNAHRRLAEAGMPYIAYPPPNSTEVMRYVPRVDTTRAFARGEHNVVFIGQIPRLLPLPYVPWAIDLLAQEYASKWVLQTQPNGCAKVWVETDAQCELLVELNKRLMFDVCGVFLARTHDEVRTMEDYQQALQVSGPIDSRVPRNGALLERLRPPQAPKQAATAPSHPTVYGATNNTPGFGAPHPPYGSTPVPVMTHVYGGAPQPGFHPGFHQPFTTAPTAFFGAPPPAM